MVNSNQRRAQFRAERRVQRWITFLQRVHLLDRSERFGKEYREARYDNQKIPSVVVAIKNSLNYKIECAILKVTGIVKDPGKKYMPTWQDYKNEWSAEYMAGMLRAVFNRSQQRAPQQVTLSKMPYFEAQDRKHKRVKSRNPVKRMSLKLVRNIVALAETFGTRATEIIVRRVVVNAINFTGYVSSAFESTRDRTKSAFNRASEFSGRIKVPVIRMPPTSIKKTFRSKIRWVVEDAKSSLKLSRDLFRDVSPMIGRAVAQKINSVQETMRVISMPFQGQKNLKALNMGIVVLVTSISALAGGWISAKMAIQKGPQAKIYAYTRSHPTPQNVVPGKYDRGTRGAIVSAAYKAANNCSSAQEIDAMKKTDNRGSWERTLDFMQRRSHWDPAVAKALHETLDDNRLMTEAKLAPSLIDHMKSFCETQKTHPSPKFGLANSLMKGLAL